MLQIETRHYSMLHFFIVPVRVNAPDMKIFTLFILLFSTSIAVDEVPDANFTESDKEESTTEIPPESTTIDVLKAWLNTERKTQENIEEMVRKMLPMLIRGSAEVNISTPCQASILKLVFGLRQNKPWAYRMGDAWGKPPGGLLMGTITSFGSFRECLNIDAIENGKSRFQGKYCLYDFRPIVPPKPRFYTHKSIVPALKNLSLSGTAQGENAKLAHYFYFLSMRFGVCFPSTCTNNDILNICSQFPKHFEVVGTSSIPHCEIKEPKKISPFQATYIALVSLLGLITFIGTFLDIILTRKMGNSSISANSNLIMRILLCFSLKKNFLKLMNTDLTPDSIPCFHGFRFFTICWVIVAHSYLYINYGTLRYSGGVGEFSQNIPFQVILNASPAVDSFFFMSGFLSMYGVLKAIEKGIKLNVKYFIFHRFWRVSPAYFLSVASMFVLPLLGSGPIWHVTLDPLLDRCRQNWWTNLIFLQNFINSDRVCIEPSWYMAVDFQLHILSLAVLIPLTKWPIVALILGSFITAACAITVGLINYFNALPPTPLAGTPDPDDRDYISSLQYFKPYVHVGPYMVGMAIGYLISKRSKIEIKPIIQLALWMSSIAIAMSLIYCSTPWNSGDGYSKEVAAIYATFAKTVWALCIGWMIFACITGHAGFINSLLSWKVWIPFSRLSFGLYLIHPLVQWVYMAYQHERLYPSHHTGIYLIFGHFMISLGIALILSLVLESPFMNLEKIIFLRTKKEIFEGSAKGKLNSKSKTNGTELKPRFISQNSSFNANGIATNGGIENKGFSSHL